MDIFERASRGKIRFQSTNGLLSVEALWDLNLVPSTRSKFQNETCLDSIAQGVAKALREIGEESFVNINPHPDRSVLELKLEILKHIITSKQKDIETAKTRAANAARRNILMDALANKQSEAIAGMSEEDIRKELEALSA